MRPLRTEVSHGKAVALAAGGQWLDLARGTATIKYAKIWQYAYVLVIVLQGYVVPYRQSEVNGENPWYLHVSLIKQVGHGHPRLAP